MIWVAAFTGLAAPRFKISMKITQEELKRRLGSNSNLVNRCFHEEKSKRGNDSENRNNAGRKEEIPNAPPSLRLVAATLTACEGNAALVARNLHLTPGQVRYAVGNTSGKLTEKKVQEIALTRLMDALNLLTPISMEGEKPKDISSIAANLSRVHSNLRDRDGERGANVNVTIYSPKQKELKDYESIEVSGS